MSTAPGGSDRDHFLAVAALLPPTDPADVGPQEAWDIGEQEGAIQAVVEALHDRGLGLTELQRGRLAAVAEHWGTWETVAERVLALPVVPADEAPWSFLEGTERALSVGAELQGEISPGHPLHGRDLAIWLECGHCGTVLARVYELAPWGRAFPADSYALVRPTWRGHAEPPAWPATDVHHSALTALEALERCGL